MIFGIAGGRKCFLGVCRSMWLMVAFFQSIGSFESTFTRDLGDKLLSTWDCYMNNTRTGCGCVMDEYLKNKKEKKQTVGPPMGGVCQLILPTIGLLLGCKREGLIV